MSGLTQLWSVHRMTIRHCPVCRAFRGKIHNRNAAYHFPTHLAGRWLSSLPFGFVDRVARVLRIKSLSLPAAHRPAIAPPPRAGPSATAGTSRLPAHGPRDRGKFVQACPVHGLGERVFFLFERNTVDIIGAEAAGLTIHQV